MPFLKSPHLDLTTSRIETERCVLVPFSFDAGVDIHEFHREFSLANQDLYVAPSIPTYDEELVFLRGSIEKIAGGEEFENFILDKNSGRLLGAGGLRILSSGKLNIGIWICACEHGKRYASEAYRVLIDWAREYTDYAFLKHSTNPANIASARLALRFGGVLQTEKTDRGHDVYHIALR